MRVRSARADDAERIAVVARRTWHAAYGDFLSAGAIDATVDEWYDPASLRAAIERDEGAFVVAVDPDHEGGDGGSNDDEESGEPVDAADGESADSGDENDGSDDADNVVGFLQAGYNESVGNVVVGRIYALPDYWGEGVGTVMLGRVARQFAAAGYERISAVVLADNEVGRAFYDARAFEEVDRRTTTFGDEQHDEVVVAADIADLTDLPTEASV
jgi:ribosomal protein S18 acetylase RimI-like enzyme